MYKHIHADTLLLLDGICHVLVDFLLVVSIAELALLVCKAGLPDGWGLGEGSNGGGGEGMGLDLLCDSVVKLL